LIGKSWRILYGDDELQRFGCEILPQFRRNGQWKGEATGKRKDGTSFPQELSLTALDNGGLICIVNDVTHRKEMDDALRDSEEKYRAIFENAMEGIFQTTPEGRLLSANPALAHICGYDSPQDIIDHLVDLDTQLYVDPEDRTIFKDILRKHGFVERFEARLYRKVGSKVWVSMNAQSVKDASGKVIFEGTLEDITMRKESEEELRTAHQRLFDIIEFLPDATFVIDDQKKVVAWNLACEQLTGIKKQAILGKGDYEYAVPFYGEKRRLLIDHVTDDSDEPQQGYQSIRRDGRHLYAENFTPVLHNGKGAILSGKASPLFDRTGKVVGAIEILRDITEVKSLESHLRQAQKMESVGRLAGGVAHDFNNILTTLIGYASLMQMKMDSSHPLRAYVGQIISAADKATDLVRGLLAFSRQQPILLVPVDVSDAIKATKDLLKRLLTEDIELRTSLAKDNTVVMADKSQIDQILFNLVTNARDAMPQGGNLVIETGAAHIDSSFITAHGFGDPGRYVTISVSDTGTGMDKATQEKIFDPFFTTKEVGKGTGLGLATVYGIVKQHNGYITVYSEQNKGTTFHIYLPALEIEISHEEQQPTSIATGNETVLVAEDDKEVRDIMRDVLSEYGYRVIEASDGEDAIEKFKQNADIDLVIIDSVMPRKNGREAYEEIHRIDPHTKVIFASGHARDIVFLKGIADREFDFISKPLSPNALLQKVREVLDHGEADRGAT
jgi:PAS domain S-box-containing protein